MPGEPPVAETAAPDRSRHQTLAFERLLARLEGGGRHRVLDLGPAVGPNVAFLAGRSAKLYIADLHQTLSGRRIGGDSSFGRLLDRDLPSTGGRPVSVILAWDLLNYLEPEEISLLGRRLGPYADPATLLFAMISTHGDLPEQPLRFEIADETTLIYERQTDGVRDSPRYKEAELRRLLPLFRVERTFLLRNGMQEYLMTRSRGGGG